jgi:hypothetical protein
MSRRQFVCGLCSLKKFFGVDLAGPAVAVAAKARIEAAMEAFMLIVGLDGVRKSGSFERLLLKMFGYRR